MLYINTSMNKQVFVPLTQGKQAIVDESDFEYLNQWKWNYTHGYARRMEYDYSNGWKNRKARYIYMHQTIMGKQDGLIIDHINQNKLDNRRKNLRFTNKGVNAFNAKPQSNKTGHTGVYKRPNGAYYCQITFRGRTYSSSNFKTLKSALVERKNYETSFYTN